jgi:hypothetical protein
MSGARAHRALLLGTTRLQDDPDHLGPLAAPPNDVASLREALTDEDRGLHRAEDVSVQLDQRRDLVVQAIEELLRPARPGDQLLLYYSGYAIADDRHRLHLCASDTMAQFPFSTAIPAGLISRMIDVSGATVVVLLDCFYSARLRAAADPPAARLAGPRRYVLANGPGGPGRARSASATAGALTEAVVAGLLGIPGHDADRYPGPVSLDDLWSFVAGRLAASGEPVPGCWFDGPGDLLVARALAPSPAEPSRAEPSAAEDALAPGTVPTPGPAASEALPGEGGHHQAGVGGSGNHEAGAGGSGGHQAGARLGGDADGHSETEAGDGGDHEAEAGVGPEKHPEAGHHPETEAGDAPGEHRGTEAGDGSQPEAEAGDGGDGEHHEAEARESRPVTGPDPGAAADPDRPAEAASEAGEGLPGAPDQPEAWPSGGRPAAAPDDLGGQFAPSGRGRPAGDPGDHPEDGKEAGSPDVAGEADAAAEERRWLGPARRPQRKSSWMDTMLTAPQRREVMGWELEFEFVRQESPHAAALLQLCAFLDPRGIPVGMLGGAGEVLPPELADITHALSAAVAVLEEHGLVERSGELLTIPRLVQFAVRSNLGPEHGREWSGRALCLVAQAFSPPGGGAAPPPWAHPTRLLVHAEAAARHAQTLGVPIQELPSVLDAIGTHLWSVGKPRSARVWFERALETNRQLHGPVDRNVAQAMEKLAAIYREVGEGDRADRLERDALIMSSSLDRGLVRPLEDDEDEAADPGRGRGRP